MITTATSPIIPNLRHNRLLQGMIAVYAVVWVVAAIAPFNRFDWLLENLLVFVFVGTLAATYRRFQFSDLSYILITLFLCLHAVGAHYTYSEAPIGHWVKEALSLERNHYDRVVHLSFGLLMAYPMYELVLRAARARGGAVHLLTFTCMVSWSTAYEVVEWVVAEIVDPDAALAYLGTQGDVFDAQKDTVLAASGTVIALLLTAALSRHAPSGPA